MFHIPPTFAFMNERPVACRYSCCGPWRAPTGPKSVASSLTLIMVKSVGKFARWKIESISSACHLLTRRGGPLTVTGLGRRREKIGWLSRFGRQRRCDREVIFRFAMFKQCCQSHGNYPKCLRFFLWCRIIFGLIGACVWSLGDCKSFTLKILMRTTLMLKKILSVSRSFLICDFRKYINSALSK